jgi:hypothetical protein
MHTPRTAAVADRFSAAHQVLVGDANAVARRIVDLFLGGDPSTVEVAL